MTKEPVTTNGYYEDEDGRFRYYSWNSGQLTAGEESFSAEELSRKQLLEAVADLGHLATPHYLEELGFSQATLERAVSEGSLRWLRDGRVEVIS